VPASTPDAVADRLTEVALAALQQPDVQTRSAQAGFLLRGQGQAGARAHVAAEHEKWGRIIRERNLTFDG
jgi:tripartite-type tricarboxylate transporter receptor subunit TctC